MESQLVVSSIIWEDESLFEISIFGSNGQFSGQADCYTNREEIDLLEKLLEKFPRNTKDEFEFKSRSTPDLSYFSIHAFCIDNSGHTMFAVTIKSNRNQKKVDFATMIGDKRAATLQK